MNRYLLWITAEITAQLFRTIDALENDEVYTKADAVIDLETLYSKHIKTLQDYAEGS